MTTKIAFPSSVKEMLKALATERHYPLALGILSQGKDDQIVLTSHQEAQVLMDIARVEMLSASLLYPFWNEDAPNYDPAHEEAFQDVQMGLFEKVAMYIGQEFEIVTTI